MRGFTLIELMVTISIVAVLSAAGATIFSKTQVKARDTTRKNDLRQIQTALDLYYEKEHKYPIGDGTGNGASCYPVNIPELKSVPKDPKTGKDYCYQGDLLGRYFNIWATLENLDERNDTNIQLENYNYFVTSNDAFIAQKSDPVDSRVITPTVVPITTPAPINRVDQSQCMIWINGSASNATYNVTVGSKVAVRGLLPGKFELYVSGAKVSGQSGFTRNDAYIYETPGVPDGPFDIKIVSINNPTILCNRGLTTTAKPDRCDADKVATRLQIATFRDNNYDLDQWPVYSPQNLCTAANLPSLALNKIKGLFEKPESEVLGTENDAWCVVNGVTQPNATACGYNSQMKQGFCFSGVCRFDWCKNSSDCNDSDVCTSNEVCGNIAHNQDTGWDVGLCSKTHLAANTVCAPSLNAPASSATMLCSGGTNSQCNVPYAQCTKASESSSTCCGTTNIQIPNSCRGACQVNIDQTVNTFPRAGLGGVLVWSKGASCGDEKAAFTDGNGKAVFDVLTKNTYNVGALSPTGMNLARSFYFMSDGDQRDGRFDFLGCNKLTCATKFMSPSKWGFVYYGFK